MASASDLFSPSSMGISGSGICWGRRRNRLIGLRCSMLEEHSAVGSSSSPKPRFPRFGSTNASALLAPLPQGSIGDRTMTREIWPWAHCFKILEVVGKGSKLIGCGSAVPKLSISNDDLAKIVETSDEWISVRTGIRNRRILSGDETLMDLAAEAARKALDMAKVEAVDVDLILMCTSTPDDLFGTGPQVQRELGCKHALAFDITAACSGFVLGLVTATRYIKGGGFQNVLVIGADALSRYVDWSDRGSCILFGDAAGAMLVQASQEDEDGLLGFDLRTDGQGQRHLHATLKADSSQHNGAAFVPPKPSSYSCIQMNGKEVFRFAVRCVPEVIEAALNGAGLSSADVNWLLLHQANQRIIDAVATRLQIQTGRVISNLSNYGNTSAASIPLALDEAIRGGQVQQGDVIATAGFGAGLTWGAAIVKWG